MTDRRMFLRGLNGFLVHKTLINKKIFQIFAFCLPIVLIADVVVMFSLYSSNMPNGGAENLFTSGLAIMTMLFLVVSVSSTTNKSINVNLLFPIDRKIFALGNFIFLSASTVVLLAVTTVAGMLEAIIMKILINVFTRATLINCITPENLIIGYIVSVSYVVFVLAMVYCISVYFFRSKLLTSLFFTAVGLVFIFPLGRSFMFEVLKFFVFESSVLLLCIKLWLCTIILNLIGFILIRRMEAN